MKKDYLIEVVNRDCPFCNKVHAVEKRERLTNALIKGEIIEYFENYFYCPERANEEENEFVPAKLMDENLLKARNEYRKKYNLLTSDEIAAIRNEYKMSQSDFSKLFGWGEVTITRYESKSIQDSTYDTMIRMVKKTPSFALELLEKQNENFGEEKFNNYRNIILDKIKEYGLVELNIQNINAQYALYNSPSDFNGNTILNLEKINAIISFFAQYCEDLYKVKLMKLLWYADAMAFKNRRRAITGLVYFHKPFGALPIANSEIIKLQNISVEEIEFENNTGFKISPKGKYNLECLAADEIDIIYRVAQKFKSSSTSEIVEYMHKEKAYMDTLPNQIIPFSMCVDLNEW